MDDGREIASARTAGESGKAARDLRQEITDRMVAALGEGRIPWEKPWQSLDHGLPRNVASGREYRGGNRLILMLEQMDRGYADSRFGTMKQINELGGRVKKGERGIPVELWKEQPFWERRDVTVTAAYGQRVKVFGEDRGTVLAGAYSDKEPTLRLNPDDLLVVHHPSGKPEETMSWKDAHSLDVMVGRVFTVFNVEQTEGMTIEPLAKAEQRFDIVERGEAIKAAMERDGLKFGEHPKFAFYSPKRDEVSVPPRGQFQDEKGYYGTLLHEIGHATGAEKRLNREGITGNHRFGSEGYAKEELRAEIFSVFMAAQTGIAHDETQHKAYIQSWAEALKKDKNEIFRAAAEAGKAVDYVLDQEREIKLERTGGHTLGTADDLSALQKIGRRQDSLLDQPPISIEQAKLFASEDVALLQSIPADSLDRYCAAVDMADIAREHPAYGAAVGEISEEVAGEITQAKAEDMRRSLEKDLRKGALLVSPASHEGPAAAEAQRRGDETPVVTPEPAKRTDIRDLPLHEQQQHPDWGAGSRETFRGKEILIVPGATPETLKAVGRTPEANEFLERRGGASRGNREIPFDRKAFVEMREAINKAGLGFEIRHDLRRQDPELVAVADQTVQQGLASVGGDEPHAVAESSGPGGGDQPEAPERQGPPRPRRRKSRGMER